MIAGKRTFAVWAAACLAGPLFLAGLAVLAGEETPPAKPSGERGTARADDPRPGLDPDPVPDDEEREYRRALARQAVQDHCWICHSDEMISSQRLTRAQWKAEVEKMIGWGAPLAGDQAAQVIEHLASTYGETTPRTPPARAGLAALLSTVGPERASTTKFREAAGRGIGAYTAQCATCHGASAQGGDLGPNLVEAAVLLRPTEFSSVVRQGRRRMPGFRAVLKPEQEAEILAWLKGLRYRGPSAR